VESEVLTSDQLNLEDLKLLETAALEAGEIALGFFQSKNKVWMKEGESPVSDADHAVNDYLHDKLRGARPQYGWLSEESEDEAYRHSAERTFVVDPIDGTRGFIDGRGEWCISIAIVENNRPVAGVLHAPKLCETYTATNASHSALNGDMIKASDADPIVSVTASRKLNMAIEKAFGEQLNVTEFIPSLALRIARVASGRLDAAFARPGAHDWDLAAADLILQQAGGILFDLLGEELSYNNHNLRAPALLASSRNNQERAIDLAKIGGFLH